MALVGDFQAMAVAELLQFMSFQEKTGTVRFRYADRILTLAFDNGRIIYTSTSDPRFQLGQLLVQQGFLSESEREKTIEVRQNSNMSLGTIAVAIGAISEDDLRALLRAKAEQEVAELLNFEEGHFEYYPDEMPQDELMTLQMDVIALLMEASRRKDEMQRSRLAADLPPLRRAVS